jgi:ABC-type Na+ transport system ATPase subunit NatA
MPAGPNGARKTTTVGTLGTLVAPTTGSAIAGVPLTAFRPGVIQATLGVTVAVGALLVVVFADWRFASALIDRERLITER